MRALRALFYSIFFIIGRPLSFVIPLEYLLKFLYKIRKIFYPLLFKRKQRALKYLSICFPEKSKKEKDIILDKLLWSCIIYPVIDLYFDKILFKTQHMVNIKKQDNFNNSIFNREEGIIILFNHSGCHQLALQFMGKLKKIYCVVAFYYEKRNIFITLQNFFRTKMHRKAPTLKYVYIKKNTPVILKGVRLLKEKKAVAMSSDGTHTKKFFKIDFLNTYKIVVPTGPFRIAASLNIKIVPLFGYFDEKEFKFNVEYGPSFEGEDPYLLARKYWNFFAEFLKKHPEGWTGWWRMELEDKQTLKLISLD